MSTINAPKAALARELGVSRAALYYRPRKPARDEALKQKIVAIMDDHPAYGQRRVAMALGRNKKPIRRVMRLFRLKPRIRRGQRPVKPDDQNRSETRVVNILKTLCPIRANIVWAGDFTYLWFIDRFWYVATVIDLWTREIIGWHVANHHTTALIMEALRDARRRTGHSPPYFHSDQGSEYVAGGYELYSSRPPVRVPPTAANPVPGRMAIRNHSTRTSSSSSATSHGFLMSANSLKLSTSRSPTTTNGASIPRSKCRPLSSAAGTNKKRRP